MLFSNHARKLQITQKPDSRFEAVGHLPKFLRAFFLLSRMIISARIFGVVKTCVLGVLSSAILVSAAFAQNQVNDTSAGQACMAVGGTLFGGNFFTAADNGTFGTGSGAADEFPATNIYAPEISGGIYRNAYPGYTHGSFSYVSNQVTRRNGGQFNGTQIDPVYGVAGRFMVSDPDDTSPQFDQSLPGLTPGSSYEISFWVADTEFNQNGAKNRIAVDVDGVQQFITPFINSNGNGNANNPVVWQKHSYVYTHASNATSATASVRINEVGSAGRDIFLDNIEMVGCSLPSDIVTTKTLSMGSSATPSVGDTVSYDITISNVGPGSSSGVSLTDLLPAGLTIAPGHGAITGDTISSGGTYNVTSGLWDVGLVALNETVTLTLVGTVDAGQNGATITNTIAAPAAGNETDPTTAGDDLTEVINVDPGNPSLGLNKTLTNNADEDGSATVSIGDTLTYTITATNTGDIPQTNFVVSDNLITPSSNSCASVAVGGTCVLTGTYVVAAGDAGGNIVNTASVVSDQVTTPVEDTVTTPVDAAMPAIGLVKALSANADEDGSTTVSIGDTLTYTITATNTGDIPQTNFVVSDNLITPSSNTCASVAVGGTCILTGTYVVAAGDAGGNIVNTASVVSDQVTTPVEDTVTTPVDAAMPAIGLVKALSANADEDGSTTVSIGDTLTYTITATNTGNAAQTNFVVSDNLITPSSNTCASVAVGGTCVLTGTYVVAAGDAGGNIVNTASVVSDQVSTPVTDVVTTPVVVNPIVAGDDTTTAAAGDTNVLDLFNGDTVNGAAATPSNVTMTLASGSTVPSELTFNPANGSVGVAAGAPAGTYSFDYQICETANPTNCTTATATVTVAPMPALGLVKTLTSNADEDGSTTVSIGDTLTYTITATNTGDIPQTNFVVSDNLITPSSNSCASVAVGGTCVLTGTYVVAAGDAGGNIVNTASVVSDQVTTPVEDTVTTPVDAAMPAIGLVKALSSNADEDGSTTVSIGDTLTYTITATNTGNAAQTNFVVSDTLITPSSNSCASVAVGGTCVLTGTYIVAAGDAGGNIVNTASVVSDQVPTPVEDTVTTPVDAAMPAIGLVKALSANADEDGSTTVSIGDTLTYTITATNTGNAAQTNFVVSDNLITPSSNTCASVAVGGTCVLTGTYVVAAGDAGGNIVNTASVVSDQVPTPVEDTVTTPVDAAMPAIGLVKALSANADEDGSTTVSIGDTLTYTITATNTGNAAQTNFVVSDNLITPSSNTCATVAVGGTCVLTGTYVVAAGDAGGNIVNTASVVSDQVTTPVEDTVTTPVDAAMPAIGLVKALSANADEDGSTTVSIGDTLTYTITATNTGDIPQTNFVVSDNLITPSSNTCASVAVGGTCILTGTYVVAAGDAGGNIVNTASVVSDQVTTPVEDTVTTPVDAAMPAIGLVKALSANADEDGSTTVSIGDTLTYTITATNTGNAAQTNFVVSDNLITPSSNTCASVAVGGTCVLTGTYVVAAGDAGGNIVNTASVVSDQVSTPVTDVVTTPVVVNPIVAGDDTTTAAAGDTNVLDLFNGDTVNGAAATPSNVTMTLASGSTVPSELTFNPANGSVGVAAGAPAGTYSFDYQICETANPTNCTTATATVTVAPMPALGLVKTLTSNADEDGSTTVSIGDTLTYTITATNTGDIPQTNFVVSDNLITPSSNSCASVAVGGTCVLTGTYVVAAGDAGGNIVNTASVVSDQVTTPVEDTVTTPVDAAMPAIGLVKALSSNADEDGSTTVSIGDTLTYTITATNTGNAAQTNFVVSDTLITPSSNSCASVAVGGTCVLTGTYIVAAGDAGGNIVNTASVVSDQVPTPVEDTVTTPVDAAMPAIGLVKALSANADEDGSTTVSIGDTLTYTITATNTGNAAQTNFVVSDNLITPSSNTCASVAVGGTCVLTGTYVVAAGDAGGNIVNTASVVSDQVSTPVTDVVTTPVVVNPIVAGDDTTTAAAGDTNVLDLFNGDTVNGAAATPSNVTMTLASGSTVPSELTFNPANGSVGVAAGAPAGTYSFDYQICETANPTNCTTATATVTVAPMPALGLVKTLTSNADEDGSTTVSIGDTLTYTITATNTGDIPQTNFVVSDNLITPSSNSCASVAVGGTCVLTGTYVVAAGDAGGNIVNTASVVSDQVPTPVEDTVTTPVDAAMPAIGLVKALSSNADEDGSTTVSIGDTLTYTITATNTGNAAQTNFVVSDNLITPSSNTCASVAVGGTCVLTGTYVVAAGDAGGNIVNTASVVSDQVPTPVEDTVTTPVDAGMPAIGLVKALSANADEDGSTTVSIGDTLTYTITATNTGNAAQTNFVVSDNLITPSSNTCASVAVGGTCVLTGTYVVAAGDAGGDIVNTASVVSDQVTTPVEDTVTTPVDAGPIIEAEPDVVTGIDSAIGGVGVINVLHDDLLNGQPINPGQVRVAFAPDSTIPAGITFNDDGTVDIAPGTPPGTYVIPYEICDVNDATNCTASNVTLVINGSAPLQPLGIMKSTQVANVNIGDIVPYTITVTNTEDVARMDLDLVDVAPPGFSLIEGTSRLNGAALEPVTTGRELVLEGIDFTANETKTWTLHMVVGAGVSDGIHTNVAFVRDSSGTEISDRADAAVKMTADPLFDCAEVIGKVYDDMNRNGYQDQGEPGIAGVRLVTVKGLIITSDEHGRYHIACAAVPSANIGSNFILKVDERSLPTGYRITTENPRVERLTRGKISKINFGASIQRVVTLDLSNEAFLPGSTTMQAAMMPNINQLLSVLKTERSVLRLNYHDYEGFGDLATKRLGAVEAEMRRLWDDQGCCYILEIERKTLRTGGLTQSHAFNGGVIR